MPFRVRLKFKPQDLGTIQEWLNIQDRAYKRSLQNMKKPIGRINMFALKMSMRKQLKKNNLPIDNIDRDLKVLLDRYQSGYTFTYEFLSQTELIVEWRDHIVIDYDGLEQEFFVRALFPLVVAGEKLKYALRQKSLKDKIMASFYDITSPAERFKNKTLEEIREDLKGTSAKVGVDI